MRIRKQSTIQPDTNISIITTFSIMLLSPVLTETSDGSDRTKKVYFLQVTDIIRIIPNHQAEYQSGNNQHNLSVSFLMYWAMNPAMNRPTICSMIGTRTIYSLSRIPPHIQTFRYDLFHGRRSVLLIRTSKKIVQFYFREKRIYKFLRN